jgi:Domain of unknown function (DUF4431)
VKSHPAEFMKKLLATIMAALFLASTLAAQAEHAVIHGTLIRHKSDLWKDSPNAAREYLVIRFDKPFETEMEDWEYNNGKDGKVRITEMHIISFGEKSDLKALVGKKVIAEGEIMERNTIHHMTPILLCVEEGNIKEGAFMKLKETTPAPTPETATGSR